MKTGIRFTLAYTGNDADDKSIDFYDVSQALIGFERSLALTTHLVLNNEIITQAPSLKGAQIYALPAEAGSWKMTAVIVISGAYTLGTTDQHSPIGHIVHSVYDYVISQSLGVHVDYNKSLGQLYEEAQARKIQIPKIRESQADSLIEKCSFAIKEMHRPIFKSETADTGFIYSFVSGKPVPLKTPFTLETYEFIHETIVSDEAEDFVGEITSYNINTYKGRIYVPSIGRPVAFELAESARTKRIIRLITSSLSASAVKDTDNNALTVRCAAYRNSSKSGHLKSLTITNVHSDTLI